MREGERSFLGFVVDPDAPHQRFVVEILLDGCPLNVMRADMFAVELARDGVGDGCYGFAVTLDESALSDGAIVEAHIANAGTLIGPPIALDRPSDTVVEITGLGEVQWVGGLRFTGWLASLKASAPLRAIVDGMLISEISSSSWRHCGTSENARPVHALDFHLPRRFADGRVHRLSVQTVRQQQLRGCPIAFLAFPNGVRDALIAGDGVGESFDADLAERLFPTSAPFASYRTWRKHLAPTSEPAAPARIAVAVIGGGDTKATFASLEQQSHRSGLAFALAATDAAAGFEPEHLRAQLAGANADAVFFCPAGARLYADALLRVAGAFGGASGASAVYGDFDVEGADGSLWPVALPAFDYERMLEQGYCCRFFALRRDTVEQSLAAGACDLYRLFNALLDANLAARDGVLHLPGALGVTPPISPATASAELAAATEAHLAARDAAAKVTPQIASIFPAARVRRRGDPPSTTIVVPWRNHPERLERRLASIAPAAAKLSAEILVVDNNSASPLSAARLPPQANVRSLRVSGDYNLSRLLNAGVGAARGEVVCLIGADVGALDDEWLGELLSRLAAPDVGVAGALVRRSSGVVQHGGFVIGPGFTAVHACGDRLVADGGYGDMLRVSRECSAVSSVCLVTRRQDYLDVGGFDELRFAGFFGDVDFCLKLRARGRRIVLTPHAQVELADTGTTGPADDEARQSATRALRNKWGEALAADPYYSPVLAWDATPFSALAWPPRPLSPRANTPPIPTDVPTGF